MKYIKKIESMSETTDKLRVGDYVIADFEFDYNPIWGEYISNTIGKAIRVGEKTYKDTIMSPGIHVKYPIGSKIYNIIAHKTLVKKDKNGKMYIIMAFNPEQILYFSKNKKELEAMLAAKKESVIIFKKKI